MLGDKQERAYAGVGEMGCREWDIRYWDNRDPGVTTSHSTRSPLYFLLRNGPQGNLARDVPRRRVGPAISRGHEGERV